MTNTQKQRLIKLKKRYIKEGYKMGIKESKIAKNNDINTVRKKILERFSAIGKHQIDIKRGLMGMDEESINMLHECLNKLIIAAHGY